MLATVYGKICAADYADLARPWAFIGKRGLPAEVASGSDCGFQPQAADASRD
jgi:hypothetical protein